MLCLAGNPPEEHSAHFPALSLSLSRYLSLSLSRVPLVWMRLASIRGLRLRRKQTRSRDPKKEEEPFQTKWRWGLVVLPLWGRSFQGLSVSLKPLVVVRSRHAKYIPQALLENCGLARRNVGTTRNRETCTEICTENLFRERKLKQRTCPGELAQRIALNNRLPVASWAGPSEPNACVFFLKIGTPCGGGLAPFGDKPM